MPKLPYLLCPLLLSLAFAASATTPTEQRIVAVADAEQLRNIALLQQLVEHNSGTFNLPGVKAVADLLQPEFAALGFTVTWKPMAQVGRAGHLLASHRGNGKGKRLLLIGHLDTVFESDNPFTGFRIDGIIAEEPDRLGEGFTLGPVAIIGLGDLPATRLVQPGSLYESKYRIRLPTGADPGAVAKRLTADFPEAGWKVADRGNGAPGTRTLTSGSW